MWVTSRDEAKREKALELGAHEAFESGARLPERVDAVIETVGEATWKHSLRALRPGGTIVVSGATSGQAPSAELQRVFFLQLNVVGSTMGTRDELDAARAAVRDDRDPPGDRPRAAAGGGPRGLRGDGRRRRLREDRVQPVVRGGPTRLVVLLGALSAFGPVSMDTYLPGLPELGRDLGASASQAQLTLTACLVGLATGQLLAGPAERRARAPACRCSSASRCSWRRRSRARRRRHLDADARRAWSRAPPAPPGS